MDKNHKCDQSIVTHYCFKCAIYICSKCIQELHPGHPVCKTAEYTEVKNNYDHDIYNWKNAQPIATFKKQINTILDQYSTQCQQSSEKVKNALKKILIQGKIEEVNPLFVKMSVPSNLPKTLEKIVESIKAIDIKQTPVQKTDKKGEIKKVASQDTFKKDARPKTSNQGKFRAVASMNLNLADHKKEASIEAQPPHPQVKDLTNDAVIGNYNSVKSLQIEYCKWYNTQNKPHYGSMAGVMKRLVNKKNVMVWDAAFNALEYIKSNKPIHKLLIACVDINTDQIKVLTSVIEKSKHLILCK